MKKNNNNLFIGILSAFCITGFIASVVLTVTYGLGVFNDNGGSNNPPIDNPNINPPLDGVTDNTVPFSKVEQTNGTYSRFTYQELETKSWNPATPSKGDVNILVVPVEFKDFNAFSENDYQIINSAFNGVFKDNSNNYWESCKSFYEKSSNGHLNLNFEICDRFVPSFTSTVFNNLADNQGTESQKIITEMYANGLTAQGKQVNLSDSKYDSNNDNYIDGIWMIYNSKNYKDVFEDNKFWAYTTTFNELDSINTSKNHLMPGRYANCSILFLGERDKFNSTSPINADAHTVIHETGHMFGLDDYYDYGNPKNIYSYTGQLDMMDLNIGDHNAYSKYALGWVKGQVITETTTLTLKPFQSSYDCLILPSGSFNGSAFSEYIMVEYYTPSHLNELDSKKRYEGNYPLLYGKNGLKIYHVDARLMNIVYDANKKFSPFKLGDYLDKSITSIPEYREISSSIAQWAYVSHSNGTGLSMYKQDAPLLELVSAKNEKLFGPAYKGRTAQNGDLFSEGSVFNASRCSNFFNYGLFNDGSPMSYEIKVNEVTPEGINITITK